jgi:hypothetical protein
MNENVAKQFKFGRLPRGQDSRIPKMKDLRLGQTPPLPTAVDYSLGMPSDLGMLLNDTLGDCVEAAMGHAQQVWTFNAQDAMATPSDPDIEAFYELAGGYVPGNPATDNGTIIQVALMDWLNNPLDGRELSAFVEVDVNNLDEVKRAIWECGALDIGFTVPSFLQNLEAPGSVWNTNPTTDNSIIGGHSVVVVGWNVQGNLILISWGSVYTMTPSFWGGFVDEAYALANPAWIKKTGLSPAGLTIAQLEALMASMRVAPRKHEEHRHFRRKRWRPGGSPPPADDAHVAPGASLFSDPTKKKGDA